MPEISHESWTVQRQLRHCSRPYQIVDHRVALCRTDVCREEELMHALILRSWILLAYVDGVMHLRSFKALHGLVRDQEVRARMTSKACVPRLCRAIEVASALYFKRVPCLQRSAATTILLRRHGSPAELVIGAQLLPFRSHAWVEIGGQVVNDKPYLRQIFQVMDRL
jgi:hypothetical protein